MKLRTSLPKEEMEKMMIPWLKMIAHRQSGSIINVTPRSQPYHIQYLMERRDLLERYIPNYEEIEIVTLDLLTLSLKSLSEKIKEILFQVKNRQAAILFLNTDQILTKQNKTLPILSEAFFNKPNVSLLFFFYKNIYLPKYLELITRSDKIIQNIFIVPYYSSEAVKHYIHFKEDEYKTKLPEKIINNIILMCGGRLWLVDEAVRYYSVSGDTKYIFNHEEMDLHVRTVFFEYDDLEQQTILKLVKKESINLNLNIIEYFMKIGLVEFSENEYKIKVGLIKKYAESTLQQQVNFTIQNHKEIIVNGINITALISQSQRKLLYEFIKNKDKTLTRTQLANIVWKDSQNLGYSDWALDMAINRLRVKLRLLGICCEVIHTKKNIGYSLKY